MLNKINSFTSYPIGDFFTLDNLSSSFQSPCLASTDNLAHQYLNIRFKNDLSSHNIRY